MIPTQKLNYNLIVILGATATGKTSLAVKLAHHFNGEIISADSRQIYKGLDLGTGKDYADYNINGKSIKYHLIDILNANQDYNVFQFQQDFLKTYKKIKAQSKNVILCGGTGLYIESVLLDYNLPEAPPNPALRKQLETESLERLRERLKTFNNNIHQKI